jgi:lipopolysaccharide export system permease protein
MRDRYVQRSDLSRVTPGVFQASRDGNRVFFIERESEDGVSARNVFILSRQKDTESVTSARSGRLQSEGNDRFLVLEKGQRNELNVATGATGIARFEDYQVLVDERASRQAEQRPPRAIRTVDLVREPTLPNQGELVWRLGLLFGAANLLLLALGLSATNPRRASNWNLLFALLGFVIYYNLINLSRAWVGNGRLGLGSAMVLLHGGVFAAALALIWWRDHAAVWVAPWKRAARPAAS